jgi:ABC-type antimicrobial peptide transport system permease subunit
MDTLALDLRAAARALLKRPALTAVAVITLALGFGANTALFSVVYAVLLRPLPFRDAERLVHVTNRVVGLDFEITSAGDFLDWRDQSRLLSGIAAYTNSEGFTLHQGDTPERLQGALVSANFLSVLGVQPTQGRSFLPTEEKLQGGRSILVSQRLWDRLFGAETRLVGQTLRLDDEIYTIVGLLPRTFLFPRNPEIDVLKPLVLDEAVERGRRLMTPVQIIARLAPGASPGPMGAELLAIQKGAQDASRESSVAAPEAEAPSPPPAAVPLREPALRGGGASPPPSAAVPLREPALRGGGEDPGPGIHRGGDPGGLPPLPETLLIIQPLREWLVGNVRLSLLMLFGSVACVLLIACANVANLLLARATSRRQEIALRAALGAGRGRIVRLLLTESVLLSLLGGAAGLLIAAWTLRPLVGLMPPDLAAGLFRQTVIRIDGPVLLFTFLLTSLAGLLFGITPALSASRVDLQDPIKESGRSGRSTTLRGLLVTAEVAVAAVLLIVAGLLLRSFLYLHAVDPGFDANRVLTAKVDLDPKQYDSPTRLSSFYQEVARRAGALPGVESVTFASSMPLTGFTMIRRGLEVEGRPPLPFEEQPEVGVVLAGPDYFRTLGILLLRGREFTAADQQGGPPVAIVSRSLARKLWGDADPIDHRIVGGRVSFTVIGIADDVKQEGVSANTQRILIYQPFLQQPPPFGIIAVRTPGNPAALTAALQRSIQSVNPAVPISDTVTLREQLRSSVADRRFQLTLFGGFALLALGLAAIGLYSVLAYTVSEQTHEIGIRMALGAARGDILSLVLRRGLFLVAVGAGLGLLLSWPAGRLVRGSLFGVVPADPITYLLIPAVLLSVALLATWLPAWRATRLDPAISLRSEQ